MDAWRRRFTTIVLGSAIASQLPITTATWAWFYQSRVASRTQLTVTVALSALLTIAVASRVLLARLREWRDGYKRRWHRVWLLEMPYYAFYAAAWFWILAIVPAGLLTWLLTALNQQPLAPAKFVYALTAVSYVVGLYSVYVRKWWTPVTQITCELDALDPALDGLVIAQLSDLHCGPNMPRWFLSHLARRASNLGAELVVMTGDFITEGEGYLDDVTFVADCASAFLGVFCSLGNHDYFGTEDGVVRAIERSGAKLLRNDGVVLTRNNGAAFFLAGVDDTWTHRDSVPAALAARPSAMPAIMLAHDPLLFEQIQKHADVALTLAGHTHGGQLSVPFLSRLTNLGRVKFAQSLGLFFSEDHRSAMYVHPGNGTSGPPIRFGVAPAIARVVLKRKSPANCQEHQP
jgi:predicted MPP superfamily phosphohydrolase